MISLIEIGGVLPEFFGTAVYISHCRIVGVQSLRSTALQFFVFLMWSYTATGFFDTVVKETVKTGMQTGSVFQECFKSRCYKFRCIVFHFKLISCTPFTGHISIGIRRTEAPEPCAGIQSAMEIIHTPFLRFGNHCFGAAEIFGAWEGELQSFACFHCLGNNKRSRIQI